LIVYYFFILQLAHQLHHYHQITGVHEFIRKEEPKDDNEEINMPTTKGGRGTRPPPTEK